MTIAVRIKSVVGIAALLLLVSSAAIAANSPWPQDHPEWFQCKTDSQCVTTAGYCSFDWAVNKKYQKQIDKLVSKGVGCAKTGTHDPHVVAQCVAGACRVADGTYACKSDSDCDIKHGNCGDMAVSKLYSAQVQPPQMCRRPMGPHDPNSFAKCVDRRCTVGVPDKHK